MQPTDKKTVVRRFRPQPEGVRWDDVPLQAYKTDGTHFRGITRQVLFKDAGELGTQLRYFEIEAGGYSSFERHRHVHAVLVLRGRGRVLVGETVYPVEAHDLVYVPPETWHQFYAASDAPLGFLCLVACDRDRPVRPDVTEAEALRRHPVVGDLMRL